MVSFMVANGWIMKCYYLPNKIMAKSKKLRAKKFDFYKYYFRLVCLGLFSALFSFSTDFSECGKPVTRLLRMRSLTLSGVNLGRAEQTAPDTKL